jgi:hypothetical protein
MSVTKEKVIGTKRIGEINSMKPYDTIIDLLPQLSADELNDIKIRVSLLSQYAVNSPGDIDDWLLRGIVKVSQDKGFGDEIPKILLIPNNRSYRGYRDKAKRVRGLFEHAIKRLSKVEKAILGQLCAECLYAKLQRYRGGGFLGLMHSVELVPEAFEEAFPNYLQMGLAHIPIRGLTALNADKEKRS